MTYYIGQAFGLFGTFCCLILPFFPQKWQMLVANAAVNICCALNLVLIGQIGPFLIVYVVAVVQVIAALRHLKTDRPVTKAENVLFLLLYVSCAFFGFGGVVDVLPVVGAVFNMLATFQTDVQKTRALVFLNSATFFAFYLLVRSASVFATICTMTTTVLAMYRHNKQSKAA